MSNIDRLDTFEGACKQFLTDLSNFKKLISNRVQSLDDQEWLFDKGFIKVCSAGDELTCDIYLPNEWNIPQLNMLGCISARYRNVDVE